MMDIRDCGRVRRQQPDRRRRPVVWLAAPLLALSALAACGSGDDDAADTTTSESTTETTAEVTTSTTSTTEPTTTPTTEPTTEPTTTPTTKPTTKPTTSTTESVNEQADGSGCTPPSETSLPDGLWFGFIDEAEDDELSFDLACWFTGNAAAIAAKQDGAESPPPNGYHVRNANPLIRTLTVDPTTEVVWLPNVGDPASAETVTYDAWRAQQPGRRFSPGVWLDIEGGEVTAIEEQYVP